MHTNNNDSNSVYKLDCLSPIEDLKNTDTGIYNQYLDQALKADNMRNIAITGSFGIGKSTILRSYNKTKKKNMLFISVLDLWVTEENPEDVKETIEQNLLKQLLSVCRQNDIPASSLKLIPEDVSIKQKVWNFIYAIYTILLSITFLFVIFRDSMNSDVLDFLHSMKVNCSDYLGNLYEKDIPIISNIFVLLQLVVKSGAYGILGILIALGIGIGTYKLISHFIVSKLAVKSDHAEGELERKDNKQENLDLHLSELIYVFEKIKKKTDCTIVFEDLDRFNAKTCLSIFVKLRQINVMVNNRVDVYRRKHRILNKIQNIYSKRFSHLTTKAQYLKFVYVCKDNIFLKGIDAYKFFDVILPVIPSLGEYNAKSYLVKRWRELKFKIEPTFIEEIASYITDYRTIINIENEYKIFSNVYSHRDTDNDGFSFSSTECMAFVIYKNLYPNEYIKITEYKKDKDQSWFESLKSNVDNDKKILSAQMSPRTLRFVEYNRSEIREYYKKTLNSGDDKSISYILDDDVKDIRCLSDTLVWSIYNTLEDDNGKFKEWVNKNKEKFLDYLVKVCACTYKNEEDQDTLKDIMEKIKEFQNDKNDNNYPIDVGKLCGNRESDYDYDYVRSFEKWLIKNDISVNDI